jgi:UDP-N-acetylglucosamine diphosphorylase/glucosamine-1-phosphate N-acetyltransferase
MKDVALQEDGIKDDLYPFALTRHVGDIRVGILTIREKWERILNQPVYLLNGNFRSGDNVLEVPANTIPSIKIASTVLEFNQESTLPWNSDVSRIIQYPWQISQFNDSELRQDFQMLTSGRKSAMIPDHVQAISPENIFIETGAVLSPCILNAYEGPIYIGKSAVIMEAATIRGPFALCEGAVVKMGAKIYGATTIGPYSVVGGEIKNSVIFGHSNKAHDGYLGDSVIGEWCNLGAGTSNSNLKNNLENIKVWNPLNGQFKEVGMKCGMFMGDYSRSAINTSFNSGALIGICSNVFGEGLTPTFIPDFSWGYKPVVKYEWEKAIRDIQNWKQLKGKTLSEEEIKQLKLIFNQS